MGTAVFRTGVDSPVNILSSTTQEPETMAIFEHVNNNIKKLPTKIKAKIMGGGMDITRESSRGQNFHDIPGNKV